MNKADVQEVIDNLNLRLAGQPDSRCAAEDEIRMAILVCHIKDLESIISEVHAWAVCGAITTPEDMMSNLPRIVEITNLDTTEINPADYCYNCGGKILGDGVTLIRHCENADVPLEAEPDAPTVFCSPAELIIEVL